MNRLLGSCAFYLAMLLALSAAQATCRDDLDRLKPSIDHIKNSNKERYIIANRWWGQASDAEPASEWQCHNYYVRATKALRDPLPEVNNCIGPNTALPACRNPGPGGVPNNAAAGGGKAAPLFAPPGSVGSTVAPYR